MSTLTDVGDRAGWRCWLCDEPVDRDLPANDARGASVDSIGASVKGRKAAKGEERLAHKACNTRKGAVTPVVAWPSTLFVADPAPIVAVVERLGRKGGREVVGRCPTRQDADEAGAWLLDRLSRLAPDLRVVTDVQPGGGQHLLVLRTV